MLYRRQTKKYYKRTEKKKSSIRLVYRGIKREKKERNTVISRNKYGRNYVVAITSVTRSVKITKGITICATRFESCRGYNDSSNSWKKKKFPPNAAFVTSRNSPLPRKLWKTCASCQSNRKSSPARTILKTVLQFHFLLEQLSLALENIAPFRKIYFFSSKNRIKLPYRKRGMIKRGRFLEKDCFLSLKKKGKNANLFVSTIINYRNDSFDGKYLGGILFILEGVSTARRAYSPADLYPPLLEERACKLSTKWRSIPLIKLHNTPSLPQGK